MSINEFAISHPCAVTRVGRPTLITAAHVGAMLDEVNVIFRQVGLHFSAGAPLRVVKTIASGRALAHEIGHACGWYDIYNDEEGFDVSELLRGMRSEWLPNDWNNGTGGALL